MKIKKLTTINWANLANKEYPLSDIVFLTGETGVGKSTMLDAIQTVLTAAHSNVVKYNAGQDETEKKQQGKKYRTMGGYFLGEDRGLFSRPFESTGTIVLTFVSSPKEPEAILNAIVNSKCSLIEQNGEREATEDNTYFFLVKGQELKIENLYSVEEHGKKVLFGDELYKKLISLYGRENVISIKGKEEYLSHLYGHLWGKKVAGRTTAMKAAKAFAKFIHAKPVDNINSFIKNEFLEQKSMKSEISKLSSAIKTLKEMKDESSEIENGINQLSNIAYKLSTILKSWEENKREGYIYSLLDYDNQEKTYIDNAQKYKVYSNDIEIKNNKSKSLLKLKYILQKELIILSSPAELNDNYLKYKNVQNNLNQLIEKLKEAKMEVFHYNVASLKTRVKNELIKLIKTEGFDSEKDLVKPLLESIETLNDNRYIDFKDASVESKCFEELFPSMIKNIQNISNIHKNIITSTEFNNISKSYKNLYGNLSGEYANARRGFKDIKSQIIEIEQHKSFTPKHIQKEIQLLKDELPFCNPSFINKYIEIKPEESMWAESIEGFIKNNRFAVIVNAEYEYEAIETVKKMKLNSLKIVQGVKMLKKLEITGGIVKENSIINKLIFNNDIAEAYLTNNYGNVLCLENEHEIKKSDRGITKDGKASNGGLMFYCKAKELVFGEGSLLLTLERLKLKAKGIEENNKTLQIKITSIETVKDIFDFLKNKIQLKNNIFYYNCKSTLSEYTRTKDLLQTIDKSDFQKIQIKIDKVTKEITELDSQQIEVAKAIGELEGKIKGKDEAIEVERKKLERKKESVEFQQKEYFNLLSLISLNIDLTKEKQLVEQQIKNIDSYSEPESLNVVIVDAWSNFRDYYSDSNIFESKHIYFTQNYHFKDFSVDFERFKELLKEKEKAEYEISRLNNTIQIKYKDQIATHEKKVKHIFVNSFCSSIYKNIKNSQLEIEEFTNKLQGHKFENESFLIEIKDAEPEFEKYKQYFKYIDENQDIINENTLFSSSDSKEELEKTKNKLFELFINNDESQQELQRIADYRNYAKYDILQVVDGRDISLSKNGKNSGGQGETSYYIVRSINLHSALNPTEANELTLESIIIDESFLKTNDTRAKEILNYLNKTLGFQIICAMPTKSANVLNEIEASNYHIVKQYTKNGDLDYTTWARYSKRDTKEIDLLAQTKKVSLFEEAKQEALEEYESIK